MKCDELKEHQFCRYDEIVHEYSGDFPNDLRLYYLKSEADKVIAELKETLNNSRNAHKYWRKEYLIEYKECLHNKYKWCLAMAEKCDYKSTIYRMMINVESSKIDSCPYFIKLYSKKKERFEKWHKRWLDIAEKFKTNSTAKQGKGDKMKATKKPVTIECFKYDGDLKNTNGEFYVDSWAVEAFQSGVIYFKDGEMYIKTLEGDHHASVGDYIIRGVNGELYPCKPDIFEKTYELVDAAEKKPTDFVHSFSWALERLKEGKRIHRSGWNGKGMFAVLQKGYPDGIPCNKQTAEAWGLKEGDLFRCEPYMQLKMVNGSHSMWVPSVNDCLSNDWDIVAG